MSTQMVFERYEKKYILEPAEREAVLRTMEGRMMIDQYGKTTIRNIYLDTGGYDLIRTSLSGPEYKEKIRIRSYKQVGPTEDVFVELKKKYRGIVYKRRVEVPVFQAMDWLCAGGEMPDSNEVTGQPNFRQIGKEIDYFLARYRKSELAPKVFLSYDREAYTPVSEEEKQSGLRITLDTNILAREDDLFLRSPVYGTPVLDKSLTVMEVKVSKDGAIPMWLARCFSENGIVKSSFSKYGKYYKDEIASGGSSDKDLKGGLLYA